MNQSAVSKKLQLEELALNMEYSFERGIDRLNRVLRITEDIEDGHFNWFDTAMTILETENPRKTITVKINTYGGDLYEALGIIARIRESKCRIITKGYGKIMSAGTLILASGHKRMMSEISTLMHHEPSYGVEGKHSEVTNHVKQAQIESDRWATLMCNFTGVPREYWIKHGHNGMDMYIDSEKALELNLVDEVF